jgi:hypothetical protein
MFDIRKTVSVAVLALTMMIGANGTSVAGTDITTLKGPGDVNVMLMYRAGGSYGRMSQQVIAPNLGDDFKEIKNIRGCAKMADFVKNTDEKMFGLWDWFSTNEPLADGSKNPCFLEQENIVSISHAFPYRACFVAGANGRSLDDFVNGKGIKVGILANGVYKAQATQVIHSINPDAKIIPYSSSKKYIPGLKSGEVDYLYSAQMRDWMTCVASTDAKETQFTPFGTLSDNFLADKNTYPAFAAFNMDMDEAFAFAQKIQQSPEMVKFLAGVGHVMPTQVTMPRREQLAFMNEWYATIQEK